MLSHNKNKYISIVSCLKMITENKHVKSGCIPAHIHNQLAMVTTCNHKYQWYSLVIITRLFNAFVLIYQTFLYVVFIQGRGPCSCVHAFTLKMSIPIPVGNWKDHTRNAYIQVSAQLKTLSSEWSLQTVYVCEDHTGSFRRQFHNQDGRFVPGTSDSWWQSAEDIVYTFRGEIRQLDGEWKSDVVDYKWGDAINVENGRFQKNNWQMIECGNAIEDVPLQGGS